jgi:hypothetical protein
MNRESEIGNMRTVHERNQPKKIFFLTVLVLGTGLKGLNINEFSEI